MAKKLPQKRYIVRKFVMANSASDAMKKESKCKVDDVFLDEKWVDAPIIGFNNNNYEKRLKTRM